jgi:glucose-1-phosphate adenylyltransferase
MIMGSDYYETLEECEYVPGCLPMGVGDGSIVRRAIIDKNARIGERCQVRLVCRSGSMCIDGNNMVGGL